jgi:hypothetical protein
MTKFAAYDDATIYAVADTAEMAIIEGRVNTNNPEAEFETAGISDALAAWIEENGWNGKYRSFDVRNFTAWLNGREMMTDYPAPTQMQLEALREWRRLFGRTWKASLRAEWESGRISSPELQALRNTHGPRWLAKFKLPPSPFAAQ